MFDLELDNLIRTHVEALNERISQKWSEVDQGIFTERDISVNISNDGDSVEVILEYRGMGAFILEYGSGSAMTVSTASRLGNFGNPALSSYKYSDAYNTARSKHGHAFVGRAKGETVYTPDGGTYQSTGRLEGKNLEQFKNPYKPQLPMHIIETEIIHWKDELGNAIRDYFGESIRNTLLEAWTGG